jgi:hypothetical protein
MRRRHSQQLDGRRVAVLAIALALLAAATAPNAGLAAADELNVSLSSSELPIGAPLALSGQAPAGGTALASTALALQADPYPYRGFQTIAHALSTPDGSFSFAGVQATLNTRLRVVVEGSPAAVSRTLSVIVDPRVAINATTLAAGRTRLSVRVGHAPQLASHSVSAWWFTAARGTRTFRLAAVTPTRELSGGVTYASTTVDPPSKRFIYRVCLNPSWERAMGAPTAHGPCPQHDFEVARDVG